jgi:hypothetical protein
METSSSLVRLAGLLGVGTQDDINGLTIGNPGSAQTGFDMLIKAGVVLHIALRDGPLTNFCIIGRLSFDIMVSDMSYLTSDDITRLWKTLARMLDTPPAQFTNSSGSVWVRFGQICGLVRDIGLSRDNTRLVEKLQPLLDMIEKIDHMRLGPPGDGRDEGTGNEDNQSSPDGSVDGKTQQSGEQA